MDEEYRLSLSSPPLCLSICLSVDGTIATSTLGDLAINWLARIPWFSLSSLCCCLPPLSSPFSLHRCSSLAAMTKAGGQAGRLWWSVNDDETRSVVRTNSRWLVVKQCGGTRKVGSPPSMQWRPNNQVRISIASPAAALNSLGIFVFFLIWVILWYFLVSFYDWDTGFC